MQTTQQDHTRIGYILGPSKRFYAFPATASTSTCNFCGSPLTTPLFLVRRVEIEYVVTQKPTQFEFFDAVHARCLDGMFRGLEQYKYIGTNAADWLRAKVSSYRVHHLIEGEDCSGYAFSTIWFSEVVHGVGGDLRVTLPIYRGKPGHGDYTDEFKDYLLELQKSRWWWATRGNGPVRPGGKFQLPPELVVG